MEDFIISETRKIFWKAINRFGENDKVDPQETSILMGLEREDGGEQTLTYRICYHHIPVRETNIMELLGVKIDLKMYSLLVPPQIKKILENFQEEDKSKKVEVCVYLDRKEDEQVIYFLYNDGQKIRDFELKDVLKLEIP
jgi:hypothetical protein